MDQSLTLRRLRLSPAIRELTREVRVVPEQLIQPHFVVDGLNAREEVAGMTGVFRENGTTLAAQIERDLEVGAGKILLFGVPREKAAAEFNFDFTAERIAELRRRFGGALWIAVDVCLCSSTTHGQCGVVSREGDHVDNGATVRELARAAVAYAQAGADCVAPSDMMDGRVRAIREALASSGNDRVALMSYSAKFNSKFYGPFRAAADSAPKPEKGGITLRDRATYQIDPARPADALASSRRDFEEGADILMVKPGMPYLDVLAQLSREIACPWAVYEVSGEYAAIELLSKQGLIDGPAAHVEAWTAFARAGASMIISYGSRFAREWINA